MQKSLMNVAGGLVVTMTGISLLAYSLLVYMAPMSRHGQVVSKSLGNKKRFRLYTNPICPFAQRAWITLAEYGALDQVTFTPVPLRGELLRTKFLHELPAWGRAVGAESYDSLQALKDWYVANINKAGEVPTLIDEGSEGAEPVVVKESDIVAEYLSFILDDGSDTKPHLFPSKEHFTAEDVARFRWALKTFPVMQFYACLRNQDPAKDVDLYTTACKNLATFLSQIDPTGPFYLGSKFTFADVACITFVYRFKYLLMHYRGMDIFHHNAGYDVNRFQVWYHAAISRPSVSKTLPTPSDVLKFYELYANDDKLDEFGFHGRGKSMMVGFS